jgi:hypothetical protein
MMTSGVIGIAMNIECTTQGKRKHATREMPLYVNGNGNRTETVSATRQTAVSARQNKIAYIGLNQNLKMEGNKNEKSRICRI